MLYSGFLFITFINWIKQTEGHGRLVDPPSRSSMWRYGFKNPPNYNDNQLYCGGVQVQYEMNGGKCGVCGDPWSGPRDNEEGGKYSNGVIVRTYEPGEIISVTIELTASHKGYFQFKLCPRNDPMEKTTQNCLDKHVLQLADGSGTRYSVPNKNGYQVLTVKLRLPEDIKCRDCTFQWKYNAGNSWGSNGSGKGGCLGCGNQEQFYGCADISIGYDDIDEGDSLITGKNLKKENYVPPPPPIAPREPSQDMNWDDNEQTSSFWDSLVSLPDEKTEAVLFKEFERFQSMFKNKKVRPCVCHSCIGNTCVCECVPTTHSNGYDSILKGVNSWLIYLISFISCLLPLVIL